MERIVDDEWLESIAEKALLAEEQRDHIRLRAVFMEGLSAGRKTRFPELEEQLTGLAAWVKQWGELKTKTDYELDVEIHRRGLFFLYGPVIAYDRRELKSSVAAFIVDCIDPSSHLRRYRAIFLVGVVIGRQTVEYRNAQARKEEMENRQRWLQMSPHLIPTVEFRSWNFSLPLDEADLVRMS